MLEYWEKHVLKLGERLQNIGLRQSRKLKLTQLCTTSGKSFVNYKHWSGVYIYNNVIMSFGVYSILNQFSYKTLAFSL